MLGSKAKRELKRNQRRILIDSIEIGIPSPQQIYAWGERRLPNGKRVGEIKNSKTVNYKRFTPLRDGLFCERIFGPVNSFVCACGKRQPRADVTFCDKCEVEYADQRTRRYRLGYIPLVSPVAHIWYLKGRPSYLSLFLGKRKKKMIALAYCNAYLVEQAFYQTPRPNVYSAPTDAMLSIKEREAHGVYRYTKNIQSSPTIRHISNLFYNSANTKSSKSQNLQPISQRNRVQSARLTDPLIDATTTSKSSALVETNESQAGEKHEKLVYTGGNSSSSTEFTKNCGQYSPLNGFQQRISKRTSPSLFYQLLAEILGHINKDVVLTDSSKKKSTHANQGKQIPYPLTKQVSLLNIKDGKSNDLFSLRPLWGYTAYQQSNQDWHNFNTLLRRAKTGFGLRQEEPTVSTYVVGSTPFNRESRSAHSSFNISTRGVEALAPFKEDTAISTSLLFRMFARAPLLLHHLWSAQKWGFLEVLPLFQGRNHSFGNLVSDKAFLYPIPTVLTLAFSLTPKKAFQAGLTDFTLQPSLKAIYQPIFSPPVEKWLASILSSLEKTSKKLYFYSEKDWQLPGSCLDNGREKVFHFYHVPFSLFLMANLHTESAKAPHSVHPPRMRCVETLDVQPQTATVKEQTSKDSTLDKEEKKGTGNKRFSTRWPFEQKNVVEWESTTQNLYLKENKKIKAATKKGVKKDYRNTHSTAAQSNLSLSTHEPSLSITAQTPQRVLNPYNRAHTLPFLPSLICKYNLRDELLNLLNSSPFDEDIPIYPYCQLERWQPLRDVHQFMSEQVLSQPAEGGLSQESVNDDTSSRFTAQTPEHTQGRGTAGIVAPRQDSASVQGQASAKRLFNLITQSTGENSPDILLNDFDSQTKKINGFSLQGEDKRRYAAWVKRTRDSARDASLLQVADRVTKEYTLLEKLASLRHILYIALFEKDFSLKAKELAARTRQISCVYTSISREKLIYDSIRLSRSAEATLNTSTHKDAKQDATSKYEFIDLNSMRSTGRFKYHLRGSGLLGKRIRATTHANSESPHRRFLKSVYTRSNGVVKRDAAILGGSSGYNSHFGKTAAKEKSAFAIESRNLLQPTQKDWPLQEILLSRRLSLQGKGAAQNRRIHPFHYLLRRHSSKNLYNSKLKETLSLSNFARKENRQLHIQARAPQFQRVPGLIGLANTLKFKSSERSYRSLLFDRTWVRSFLLEKHLLNQKRYPTIFASKTLTSLETQKSVMRGQGKLAFNPQIRPVPSYVHAFRQHGNNKQQFNSYTLLIQDAWPLKSKKTAFQGVEPPDVFTPERTRHVQILQGTQQSENADVGETRRTQNRVEHIGKRARFLGSNPAQQNCAIANNTVKKSVAEHEKRFINRVYNLTFFLADSDTETTKEGFSICQLVPPPTKSFETVNSILPFYTGQMKTRVVTYATAYAAWRASKAQHQTEDIEAWKYSEHNLPNATQQERESLASSALSFFLVLPHLYKTQRSKSNRFASTDTKESTKSLENQTALQVQLKNGNSKLWNKPQMVLNTSAHHVHTDSDFLEIAKTSSFNTSKPFQKSAAESTSFAFNDQLAAKMKRLNSSSLFKGRELAEATPPLNREEFSQTLSLNKEELLQSPKVLEQEHSTGGIYQVPAAYRDRRFLRDHYNNGKKLLGNSANVSVQNKHLINTGMLERGEASAKASPTHEITTGPTQQGAKKVSAFANQSTVLQQDSTFASLELTTIREILSYTGGGALQKLLQRFDTQLFATFLFADIKAARTTYKQKVLQKSCTPSRIQKRILTRLCRRIYKNSRRLKIAQLLTRCKRRPEWMMISVLPVLPPDLRPILQMSESVVVASDLNNLYQRVVYRNNRFYKLNFIDFYLVTAIQRLVQDAVDRLIENGKGGSKPFYTPGGRPLKSLSDTLKGKKGRFRLNLLGKRVDFSGRSVIVVSPSLRVHECGLPREIALELYHYFLLRQLMLRQQASSIIMAKKIIQQRNAFVWDVLRDIVYHHPVLLNRAPTLHRLGIQAFQPKLVKGNAILLNPLVCSGFNADFDGDQMGVHLPLSTQARAEAWDLLWSRNNLLSPATGQPVLVPSQDMVLGFYYMTQSFSSRSLLAIRANRRDVPPERKQLLWNAVDRARKKPSQLKNSLISRDYTPKDRRIPTARELVSANRVFFSCSELLRAFQNKNIHLHTPVWLQWQGKMENDEGEQTPLQLRINNFGSSTCIYCKYKRRKDESCSQSTLYIRTTAGRVLVNSLLF